MPVLKPLPHVKSKPQPKRLPRVKAMTIAASFMCSQGAVICADTQESVDNYLKRRVPKIAIRPQEQLTEIVPLRAVFAGAGDSAFIDKLIDEMWSAVAGMPSHSATDIIEAMEDALLTVHEKIWKVYGSSERPEADLLIGLWAENRIALLKAQGPILNIFTQYDCIGYGQIFARYIVDRLYRPTLSIAQTILLSLYMLSQVKEHAEGCGGESHVVLMSNSGQFGWVHRSDVIDSVRHLRMLDSDIGNVLLTAPDLRILDEEFEKRLQDFVSRLRVSRHVHKDASEWSQKVVEKFGNKLTKEDPEENS